MSSYKFKSQDDEGTLLFQNDKKKQIHICSFQGLLDWFETEDCEVDRISLQIETNYSDFESDGDPYQVMPMTNELESSVLVRPAHLQDPHLFYCIPVTPSLWEELCQETNEYGYCYFGCWLEFDCFETDI